MTLTSPAAAAAVLPASPRLAVLASPAPAAQAALEELSRSRTWAPLDEADVLVTVGGDGTLLHALHRLASAGLQVPVFGLHRGTTGFLLNAWRRQEDLETRLRTARPLRGSRRPPGRPARAPAAPPAPAASGRRTAVRR